LIDYIFIKTGNPAFFNSCQIKS